MIGFRFLDARTISEKRWIYFHSKKEWRAWLGRFIKPPRGMYKKTKGCECRHCTRIKKYKKETTNGIVRRLKGSISSGMSYKKLL